MTKREIAAEVSKRTGITQLEVLKVVENTLDVIRKHLSDGGMVELRNFGVWKTVQTKPRIGRNPRSPAVAIAIPSRRIVRFKMTKNWPNNGTPASA